MSQKPEFFLNDEAGLSESEFAGGQEELRHLADYDKANREVWEKQKGGTFYIMFPDQGTRQAVINFINNDYRKRFPVKAAEDPHRDTGVKIDFNNDASEQKDVLLTILTQRGWQAMEEDKYFAEHIYEPKPQSEALLPPINPPDRRLQPLPKGKPRKPAARDLPESLAA